MKILSVEVQVTFHLEHDESISGIVEIPCTEPIDSQKLIDACQRAVANCTETLQNNLDNQRNGE